VAQIAVEIRPEGVLLRPESEEQDNTDALLADMQDDAPKPKRRLFRWGRN
jgi:hypothetical protein